jgi:hypothetical protein
VVGEWVVSFLCGTAPRTRGGDVAADGDATRAAASGWARRLTALKRPCVNLDWSAGAWRESKSRRREGIGLGGVRIGSAACTWTVSDLDVKSSSKFCLTSLVMFSCGLA